MYLCIFTATVITVYRHDMGGIFASASGYDVDLK